MGWCSGSELAENIFTKVESYLPKDKRKEVAQLIYDEFCNMDADCWDDTMRIMKYIEIEEEN